MVSTRKMIELKYVIYKMLTRQPSCNGPRFVFLDLNFKGSYRNTNIQIRFNNELNFTVHYSYIK